MNKKRISLFLSIITVFIIILISILLLSGIFSVTAVSTSSMEPSYEGYLTKEGNFNYFKGDLIILEKKTPKIGDLILFKSPESGKFILHRIIAMGIDNGEINFITKGDNNIDSDQKFNHLWVRENDILGVAIISIPILGGLMNSVLHPIGLILIGIFGIILFLILVNRNQIKHFFLSKIKIAKFSKKNISLNIRRNEIRFSLKLLSVFLIVFLILISAIFLNIFYYFTNTNSVSLLSIDGEKLPENISLSNIHDFSFETFNFGNRTIYLYNVKLLITSSGFFNSIKNITISSSYLGVNYTNSADNFRNYSEYSILYSFDGTKIINSALIFIDPFRFDDEVQVKISLKLTSFGLFHNNLIEKFYNINLK